MPNSPAGNDPDSSSNSNGAASESSDSSSSDFEIQAVTTSDGVRTSASAEEVSKPAEEVKEHNESEVVEIRNKTTEENPSNPLGLNAYSDSSLSDEDRPTSVNKPNARSKKRVRFAEDPPEKKLRVERRSLTMNGSPNGHNDANAKNEEDEAAILAQFAEFEAAVADHGRDSDQIEADLAEADDAREQAEQQELEERIKRLREAVMRRKARMDVGESNDLQDESSSDDSSDEVGDVGILKSTSRSS